MTPSQSNPLQKPALSPPSAYLYLLTSLKNPEVYKLGTTRRPAARFDSLTKSYGEFDLEQSVLIAAKSRRAALDLERVLRTTFNAAAWRAEPPRRLTGANRRARSNGDTEWYRSTAFPVMIELVRAMIERDVCCELHRFNLVGKIEHSALWRERLRDDGVQTRFRSARDVERDAQARLDRSEANFTRVESWLLARRHQLVSVTPWTSDNQGNRARSLVFRSENEGGRMTDQDEAAWQDIVSACVISYRSTQGVKSLSYFGGLTSSSDDPSTYSAEFLVTPAFTRAGEECPMMRGLLSRITARLSAPQLPS